MKCVKVELKKAEKAKLKLINLGVFNRKYIADRDSKYVYFSVTKNVKGFENTNRKLKKSILKGTLVDLLKNKLTSKELKELTKSYDLVGGVAILEIDDPLLKKKKLIADAILKINKNVRTVIRSLGGHEGEYRVRNYEYLAGENNLETLYKENGVNLILDVTKTYFSPRLSKERMRIASLAKKDEDVLVMFSGVGIYSLVIAKHSNAKLIYGVEINPDSCKYAEKSLDLNKKLKDKIKLFCGDVLEIVPKLNNKFDRIIMPLPATSISFLDLALKYLNKKGIIHLYCFSEENLVNDLIKSLENKYFFKIFNVVKTGQSSPRTYRYCFDIVV